MTLLETHPEVSIGFYNIHEAMRNIEQRIPTELEDLANPATPAMIEGDLCSYVVLLVQDLICCLRGLDVHCARFVRRLQDEVRARDLAGRVQKYLEGKDTHAVTQLALIQVKLL